jgi:hypothetical protein
VDGRAFPECGCVEDDSFMSYVVYLEREETRCFEDSTRTLEELIHFSFLLFSLGQLLG